MPHKNRRLGLLRGNGIQTLFVESERLSGEKKHLVRKELARVMAVAVDGLFGIEKE